jgi:hypothetical protein
VVGIAAAAIIAGNQHDDHHNKNKNNKMNYDNNYYDSYDDGHYSNSRNGYNVYGGDPRRTFSCESKNSRRNYCSISTRGHVEI